jgi:hypothetical protein
VPEKRGCSVCRTPRALLGPAAMAARLRARAAAVQQSAQQANELEQLLLEQACVVKVTGMQGQAAQG